MKYLEVRRHSMRMKPGIHLSQDGVALARRVGDHMGPFARVVTSTLPRAYETALAMGFAVDVQEGQLNTLGQAVSDEISWDAGFAAYAQAALTGGAVTEFVRRQAALWLSLTNALSEGMAGLVISHGGIVEAGAVGCLPAADHVEWGAALDYCEGVCLTFEGDRFVGAQILRV